MMTYKGFLGTAQIDHDAKVLRGHVVNTRDTITFQSPTVEGLEAEFRMSVDVYLEVCAEKGIKPEKPYAGRILLRVKPAEQKALVIAAASEKKSLNRYLGDMVAKHVAEKSARVDRGKAEVPGSGTSHAAKKSKT